MDVSRSTVTSDIFSSAPVHKPDVEVGFKGMKDKRTGTVLCETYFTPRNLQVSMVMMMLKSGTSEFHYWHLQLGGRNRFHAQSTRIFHCHCCFLECQAHGVYKAHRDTYECDSCNINKVEFNLNEE